MKAQPRSAVKISIWMVFASSASLFAQSSGARNGRISELHESYISTVESLMDTTRPARYLSGIAPEFVNGDPALGLKNPRSFILQNLWCWSEMDSYPTCKTTFYSGEEIVLILRPFEPSNKYFHWPGSPAITAHTRKGEQFIRQDYDFKDENLLKILETVNGDISSVRIQKREEMDKGWIAFETLYLVPGTFLVAALLDFSVSKAMGAEFSPGRAALVSAGIGAVYAGYRLATWKDVVRVRIIEVKF